jgi:hypothetical protein
MTFLVTISRLPDKLSAADALLICQLERVADLLAPFPHYNETLILHAGCANPVAN